VWLFRIAFSVTINETQAIGLCHQIPKSTCGMLLPWWWLTHWHTDKTDWPLNSACMHVVASWVQTATSQNECATPPYVHLYVIAVYQALPGISTASKKHWGEKAWVATRLTYGNHGTYFCVCVVCCMQTSDFCSKFHLTWPNMEWISMYQGHQASSLLQE